MYMYITYILLDKAYTAHRHITYIQCTPDEIYLSLRQGHAFFNKKVVII